MSVRRGRRRVRDARYALPTTATRRPSRAMRRAISIATGVLPAPPSVAPPTPITRAPAGTATGRTGSAIAAHNADSEAAGGDRHAPRSRRSATKRRKPGMHGRVARPAERRQRLGSARGAAPPARGSTCASSPRTPRPARLAPRPRARRGNAAPPGTAGRRVLEDTAAAGRSLDVRWRLDHRCAARVGTRPPTHRRAPATGGCLDGAVLPSREGWRMSPPKTSWAASDSCPHVGANGVVADDCAWCVGPTPRRKKSRHERFRA